MTRSSYLSTGWFHVKEHAPAVMAAALMYGGIHQTLGVLRYLLAGVTLKGINAVIRKGFRDRMPLPNDYTGIPWQYHAKVVAVGAIVLAVGMFLGLWVNARRQRQRAP